MENQDPAFLFYSKDWLQGTAKLFPAEKGVFADLLAHHHQDGFLPTNLKRLAKMSGLPLDEFIEIWEGIKHKFYEKDGNFYNKKLVSVVNDRVEHGEMRAIIGTFGQLIKKEVCSEDKKAEIRKKFNYKDFLDTDKANLSKCLSKFISNCLTNGQAIIEDGTEDGIEDGDNNKEKSKFWFLKFYHSTYDHYKEIFNGQSTTEAYFTQWKTFINFIYQKKYEEIFECKFLSPHDFASLVKNENFIEENWEIPIKKILATGIKPEHNLFYRIPEFIKYSKKDNGTDKKPIGIIAKELGAHQLLNSLKQGFTK